MPLQHKTNTSNKPISIITRTSYDTHDISMYSPYITSFLSSNLALEALSPTPTLPYVITIHNTLNLTPDTLYLSIHIINSILKIRSLSPCKEKLLVTASLFIASKYEEVFPPHISAFIEYGTESEILRAEKYILHLMDYNLSFSNPLNFLRHVCKADGYDKERRLIAKYILEKCVIAGVGYLHSKIAVGAVYLAWKITKYEGNENILFYYSPYGKSEILKVLEEIWSVFGRGMCVVDEKYGRMEYGSVSSRVIKFFGR